MGTESFDSVYFVQIQTRHKSFLIFFYKGDLMNEDIFLNNFYSCLFSVFHHW